MADRNIPLDTLLSGPGGVVERLAERYNDSVIGAMSAAQFRERVGLQPSAFIEARAVMRHEAVAFGRNLTATLPPMPLVISSPTGTPRFPTFPYYAATAMPPRPPPAVHYAHLATGSEEFVDDREVWTATAGSAAPGPEYARRGTAQTLDYTWTTAFRLGSSDSGLPDRARDILATVLIDRDLRQGVRIESCYRYFQTAIHEARIRVLGIEDPNDVLLVDGVAGLTCAVDGHVEGLPCRLSQHIVTPHVTTTGTPEADVGYRAYVEMQLRYLPYPQYRRYFIVRRKPGATALASRSYEPLGTFGIEYTSTFSPEWRYCHNEPAIPDLTELAATALIPDPANCAQPRTSCAGVPQRLPLEDELIDDGDAFETSWRYHLNVARAAAERADELGERLINQGLSMDLRSEDALATLEDECGAIASVEGLFDASLADARGGDCPEGNECGVDYECDNGLCRLDLVARAARLAESSHDERLLRDCLDRSEDAIYPVISLGTTPLCYWYRSDDPSVICEGANPEGGLDCPYLPDSDGLCTENPAPPGGGVTYIPAPVSAQLRIFGEDDGAGGMTGSSAIQPLDCNLVRSLRRGALPAGMTAAQAALEIRRTNFYAIENARRWANRLGWEGRPLDFSAVLLDGSPWYGTGDPFDAGVNTTMWPCGDDYVGDDPSCTAGDTRSLFCGARAPGAALNCNDTLARARFNDRLARAVLALGITTGVGVGNMALPTLYQGPPLNTDVLAHSINTTIVSDIMVDGYWRLGSAATFHNDTTPYSGAVIAQVGLGHPAVWHTGGSWRSAWTLDSVHMGTDTGTTSFDELTPYPLYAASGRPFSFVRMGSLTGPLAERIGDAWWSGMDWNGGSTWHGWTPRFRVMLDASASPEILGVLENVVVWDGRASYGRHDCSDCAPAGHSLTRYWGHPTFGWSTTDSGYAVNQGMVAPDGIRRRDMWDALELMCEASRYGEEHWNCDPQRPPAVNSVADLPALRSYMECLAGLIEQQGERILIQNVPRRAVDALSDGSSGQSPAEGEYGRALSGMRETLLSLRGYPRAIATELRGFALDLELLEIALNNVAGRRELQDLSTMSTVFSQVAACGSSSTAWGAVATCANAVAQIVISFRVRDITLGMLDDEARGQVATFAERAQGRQEALNRVIEQVGELGERLNGQVASLGTSRGRASRALARATFAGSDHAGRHYHVNTVMRRQYNTLFRRYRRAHDDAIRMTFIAKRALEQRLGIELADLREDMTLVDAPARWEARLCTLPTIDYARIRDETELPSDDYASSYVGDYVRDLERVFDSYRFDFPFTSTTDTAVISLRDDILNVRRAGCEVRTYNLLASSGDLQASPWVVDEEGCTPIGPEGIVESCVSAQPWRPADGSAAPDFGPDVMGTARPFRVAFGATTSEPMSYTNDANLHQEIRDLPSGRYRLSWFGATVPAVIQQTPQGAVDVLRVDGSALPSSPVLLAPDTPGGGWTRHYSFFDVSAPTTVRVRIKSIGMENTLFEQAVGLAAFVLEDVSGVVSGSLTSINQTLVDADTEGRYRPRVFVETDAAGMGHLATCEDTDGRVFRTHFSSDCHRLCSAGFGATCPDEDGEPASTQCFREISFDLDQRTIERGESLARSGFAYGNFNYRVDSVAVNVVGSAARVCDDPAWPSTCYSSGSIPFSLEHHGLARGGYVVRNHRGGEYSAPLYLGRIEHARALATERYITNPISSSDEAMIGPYTHTEWRGRPLDGRYVLRLWNAPGVNFRGIEDVQIVVRYRYWTRAE